MNFLFSKTFTSTIRAFYIWVIGLCIGAIIATGAFSAPVIFHAQEYGVDITKFQSGILMTQIFLKLNVLLLFVAFFIAIYEILSFKLSNHTKMQKYILFISGAIAVICILLFSLYYSPFIVSQQELGINATASAKFQSMHSQSEMIFHILFFALTLNLIYRNMLQHK